MSLGASEARPLHVHWLAGLVQRDSTVSWILDDSWPWHRRARLCPIRGEDSVLIPYGRSRLRQTSESATVRRDPRGNKSWAVGIIMLEETPERRMRMLLDGLQNPFNRTRRLHMCTYLRNSAARSRRASYAQGVYSSLSYSSSSTLAHRMFAYCLTYCRWANACLVSVELCTLTSYRHIQLSPGCPFTLAHRCPVFGGHGRRSVVGKRASAGYLRMAIG